MAELKWIKSLSDTNSKKKGMTENKGSFAIKTIQLRSF